MQSDIQAFFSYASQWYPYGIPLERKKVLHVSFVTPDVDKASALIEAAAEKGMKLSRQSYEIIDDVHKAGGGCIIVLGNSTDGSFDDLSEGNWDSSGKVLKTLSHLAIQSSVEMKRKFWEHLQQALLRIGKR